MGFLSRIFGGRHPPSTAPNIKKILREADRSAKTYLEKAAPFNAVSFAIIHAATECVKRIEPLLGGDNKQDQTFYKMEATYQFLYFFVHMTLREAQSTLGYERTDKLLEIIFPMIATVAVDSFWEHLPVEKKKELRSLFFHQMQAAEEDYAMATDFFSKDEPYTGESLLSKLGRNIAIRIDRTHNPEVIFQVTVAVFGELPAFKISELVKAIRDAVDDFELFKYDPWDEPS